MKTMKYIVAFSLLFSSLAISAQTLKVNADASSIGWHGSKIGGEHNGTIDLKNGEITMENNQITSGKFVVDMTSIKNLDIEDAGYKAKLEGHLKSDDFFGVATFPTSKLVISKSEKFQNGKAKVWGNLTIKGKTEKVEFDMVENAGKYSAELKVDRSKFDVRYGSNSFFDNLGDKAIDDIFTLTVELVML